MHGTRRPRWSIALVLAVLAVRAAGSPPAEEALGTAATADGRRIVTVSRSTPELPRKGEADVVELADGRLLLVSMEFGGDGSDFARTRLVAHESSDGGLTWGGHRVVTETAAGDVNVYSPNLLHALDGGILLLFHRHHGKVPGVGDAYTLHAWKAKADGRTFAPLAEFAPRQGFALCNATVKRLASGRLLLPASVAVPGDHGPWGKYAATTLWSDDDGRSWQASATRLTLPQRGAMEPHVEETGDGRVLMVMRNQLGRIYQADSRDGGASWSEPEPSPLTAPESCPELTRVPSTGDLLMIWNESYDPHFRSHYGKRSPLVAAISRDHGRTWGPPRAIETDPRRAFSNPGCRFTRRGTAIVNYWTCEYLPDWALQDVIDLRVAAIDTAWFYGGPVATSSQPVHPLLIRNDHGPVTRVDLSMPAGWDARATSFTFRLDGTDDLSDIDSVRLFAAGDTGAFTTATPVGAATAAAEQLTITCDQPLRAGTSTFWLSCRLVPTADLLHHVAATCTAIETSAGPVVPRDTTPGARHRIGVALRRPQEDGVHTSRIPALTRSAEGTLLCVYDLRRAGGGRDLQEDIDIGLSRSVDGGRTWEPPRVIMDMGEYGGLPQAQNGCSDPGIIVDRQTGEIFCFAVWMHGKPGKHQWNDDGSEAGFEIGVTAQLLMVRSRDDGVTWSRPENMTRTLKQESWWLLAPAPQSGIQLADGTLVMPVQGRTGRAREATFATIMVSRDHGATWTVRNPAYEGGNECQAALLGDGAIMLNVRNDRERFRAVAVTRDLGETWTPHPTSRTTLIEPNCNGSLLRAEYGRGGAVRSVLLFANPRSRHSRTQHTVQVSFDDGMTWPPAHHLLLDAGRGAGYPSLTQIDDRHVGIVYEGSQAHLVFEKLPLAALIEGR
jgi:sialidase-1